MAIIDSPDDRPEGTCRSLRPCGNDQASDSDLCPEHRDNARAVMGAENGSYQEGKNADSQ